MQSWTSNELVPLVGGTLEGPSFSGTGFVFDSRSVAPGNIFLALPGQRDGHLFIKDALDRGAVASIMSRPIGPGVVVPDVLKALEAIAAANRAKINATCIAITGSAGKTTTKEILTHLLRKVAPTFSSPKSYNNFIGVPLTLANCPLDVTYAIFEMGMNHPGEIKPLSLLVQPDIALITNIYPVHLEFLRTIENIAHAKAEIFEGLKENGIAIVPDPFKWINSKHRVIHKGRLIKIEPLDDGQQIQAEILGQSLVYTVHDRGEAIALNSIDALTIIGALGIDLEKAALALSSFKTLPGRGEASELPWKKGTITLIDESYNANPEAVKKALERLQYFSPVGRRIFVFGQMGELGPEAPAYHIQLADSIRAARIDQFYACGPLTKDLHHTLNLPGRYADTITQLIPSIIDDLKAGDLILVKGSNKENLKSLIDLLRKPEMAWGVLGKAKPSIA